MDNELHLLDSCSIIPDNSFDDYQAQAKHSATYILWLIKVKVVSLRFNFVATLHNPVLSSFLDAYVALTCLSKSLIPDGLNFKRS